MISSLEKSSVVRDIRNGEEKRNLNPKPYIKLAL